MRNMMLMARGCQVMPLAVQLLRQPNLFDQDTYLRDLPGYPFKDVDTVYLRYTPAVKDEEERKTVEAQETVWMEGAMHLPAARPLIFGLMTLLEGERLGRVMVNRLKPGGHIFAHEDPIEHAGYWDRFHYVVSGLPGVIFRCGGEEVQMLTGELWWFQNALTHEVINNSGVDRLHLIIDIRTQHVAVKGHLPQRPLEVTP